MQHLGPTQKIWTVFKPQQELLQIPKNEWMNEWMDWAIDTMDLAQEPILESAQEYQDDDVFR